jgi:hypothetical protein
MGGAILIESLPDIPFCAAVTDSAFADLPALGRWRIGTELHLPGALHGLVANPFVAAAVLYLVPGAVHTQAWTAAPREYPARVLAFLAAHQ